MCLGSTIFIIEDDVAVQDALSISITMAGFKIEVYPSGKAFLDAFTGDWPGCLLISLSQPRMDGLTVQQELIRRNILIPIIFMIGIGMIRDGVSAMQSGAFCLLEKPFSRQLLLDSIRAAIKQDCENRLAINVHAKTDGFKSPPKFMATYFQSGKKEIYA